MVLTSVLIFAVALVLVLVAIPPVINVARQKHLFDEPSEDRKVHVYRTPNLGGVAIFVSILLTLCLFIPFNLIPHVNYVIAATLLLFVLGLKDDLVGLSPLIKFSIQIIAAIIVCYFADIRLTNMYGFFGITTISMPLSLMISTLAILLVVNAFNLIDGIDCLAGSVGLTASLTFAYCFFELNQIGLMYLSLAIAGALLGFLYFNRTPAKIFMGDTGSLMLGFLISILSIEFIEANRFDPVTNAHPVFQSAPAIICGILVIPVFDTLRVFTLRLLKGMSPFNADRNHIHHRLIGFELTHMQSVGILVLVNLLFIGVSFSFRKMGTLELFLFISILALSLNLVSWHCYNVKMKSSRLASDDSLEEHLDNIVKLKAKEKLALDSKEASITNKAFKTFNNPSN